MMIKYDFQMEDLKNDERFLYDDDCGQYIFRGNYLGIVINKWNQKVNVYYTHKNSDKSLLNIPVGELRVLYEIMDLCVFEKYNEEDE